MIELCCECLSKRVIWLYVLVMPLTRCRGSPLSTVAWMSRNSLVEADAKSQMKTQPFSQTGQMVELCCEYLSVLVSTYLISRLFWAKSTLTFRQSVDSLWNAYVTWQECTVKCTVHISTHNTAQSFDQFG